MSLTNKVVVVTGALGQLGSAYLRKISDMGGIPIALDIASPSNDSPKNYIQADVRDQKALLNAAEQIINTYGHIDGLVNNAALDTPPDASSSFTGPFESMCPDDIRAVIDVNVLGTILPTQVFGARMVEQGAGSTVNIASIYGKVSPDQTIYEYRRLRGEVFYKPLPYSVSKSAIYNLTRYLATYWAKAGVRVNTLTIAGVYRAQDPEFINAYTKRIPIGRMADPDDYVGPLAFLLSDDSRYMTGSDLVVDGGWTAI